MTKNSLLPTVDQFRTDFPEFSDKTHYPDTAINFYLGQADNLLDQTVHGDQFVYLAELFTAHYVELRGKAVMGASISGRVNTAAGGIATSKSVDKVGASYDVSGIINPDAGFWNNTAYGREFFWWWSMFGAGGRQLL
ncbi:MULTISPECIES: DUF4054 domain-containing protein [unclassified Photorhabdus]|uniref:DUF4054 domain-containing protein n=1 Tax=unclassified Photorhabdus TaxID=2620880 RepID=UPI000DCD2649|nr:MULTISPECIES: DUF4054 domain-containing protein [unclassified Photorhabdus]RAW93852.1 hypothetical protein CKY03_21630 [Photorhabdus sp. S9-53]RAW97253.1 hypothetical protein CKY04_21685 [Photorhabdus sp. S8-52]RAW97619.1 hypothetical protein CKY05_13410 [Photorhabdus sp. S10-54]